jgi:hypothetical protein
MEAFDMGPGSGPDDQLEPTPQQQRGSATPKQLSGLPNMEAFDMGPGSGLDDQLEHKPPPQHKPPQVSRFEFANGGGGERSSASTESSAPPSTPFVEVQPRPSVPVVPSAAPQAAVPNDTTRTPPTKSRFLELDPLPAPSVALPPPSPELKNAADFERLLAGLVVSHAS